MSLASLNRRKNYQSFKQGYYDLVIIGGGITGAGIALDAVTRGMKVALVEKQDFAFGASSRSTKMIHGGLRYLQKFQFKNVSKTSKERARIYENAPHVMTREKMLLPIHKGGTLGKFTTSLGLKFYDYLADVKQDERRKMLSRDEVIAKVPAIKTTGLRGAGEYAEYRTDDARMTLEIIKKAVEKGADCLNYAEAVGFNYDDKGYVEAVVVKDTLSGNTHIVEGAMILNATGAWMLDLCKDALRQEASIDLIKGAHLVFDQSNFPLTDAIYFDTGVEKKMIFAVPRGNKTYVGVSSSRYDGNREQPSVSITDQHYLLTAINEMFPELKITPEMIESSWAGISPVLKDEHHERSLEKQPLLRTADNGLITVTIGKLTGYRELAESVVDEIAGKLKVAKNLSFEACQTADLPLSGGDLGGSDAFVSFIDEAVQRGIAANLTEAEARELASIYGSNVDKLFEIAAKASPDEMQGLPILLYVKLIYGLTHEAIVSPSDFFVRRTGALYFDIETVKAHHVAVVKFMARYFGWTVAAVKQYNAGLEAALYHATHRVEDDRVVKLEAPSSEAAKGEESPSKDAADVALKTASEDAENNAEKPVQK